MVADGLDGVQRAERVLEDHLHLRAIAESWRRLLAGDVAFLEEHLSPARFVEACEQARDGRLPAAALAHERGDRPGTKLKGDVVHCVDIAPGLGGRRSESASSRPRTSTVELMHRLRRRGGTRPRGRARRARAGTLGRLPGEQAGVRRVAVRAARVESASRGRVREVRGRTGNARQPGPAGRAAAETTAGAPACRDAVGACASRPAVADSTTSPAYMIAIRCATSRGARGRA